MADARPINAFGVAAGWCSMANFIPQVFRIEGERDASGVSLRIYAVTTIGCLC